MKKQTKKKKPVGYKITASSVVDVNGKEMSDIYNFSGVPLVKKKSTKNGK